MPTARDGHLPSARSPPCVKYPGCIARPVTAIHRWLSRRLETCRDTRPRSHPLVGSQCSTRRSPASLTLPRWAAAARVQPQASLSSILRGSLSGPHRQTGGLRIQHRFVTTSRRCSGPGIGCEPWRRGKTHAWRRCWNVGASSLQRHRGGAGEKQACRDRQTKLARGNVRHLVQELLDTVEYLFSLRRPIRIGLRWCRRHASLSSVLGIRSFNPRWTRGDHPVLSRRACSRLFAPASDGLAT